MKNWKQFVQHRLALISLFYLVIISIMAVAAPLVTPSSYEEQNIAERLQGPSLKHWMGTDNLGRDLYSRIIYGARMSLAVGITTAVFSLILGTFTGSIAGYWGGRMDHLIMGIVDIFYMFPVLLMAILLMLLLGRGFTGIFIALGLATWMSQARIVRGLTLLNREMAYVEAAKATGITDLRIIFRHIIPNLLGPIIVSLTFQIPSNIMAESFLSFIGLGLQPPFSSWGTLANEGFRAIKSYPHLIIFPGLVLFITMLAFSYLGDGLRDLLDPKSKKTI